MGMVDISRKKITKRVALASARVILGRKAFNTLQKEGSPKGNVFEAAKIAGVMAAKMTPQVIPLCHPLDIHSVDITFRSLKKDHSIVVLSQVAALGRTGVEMEALTAATIAALTIYDMMKWADKSIRIESVQLEFKSGGKSGTYRTARSIL